MDKFTQQVKVFHDQFKLPVRNTLGLPAKDRIQLRISLLQEELNELKEGLFNNDLENVVKELADLQYVLSGTVLELGLQDIFENAFTEVHLSNMSKQCKTLEDAQATKRYYEAQYIPTMIKHDNGAYSVLRLSDGKLMKSLSYHKANISQFIKDNDADNRRKNDGNCCQGKQA